MLNVDTVQNVLHFISN